MIDEAKRQAYRQLQAPRPIQNKNPTLTKSLLQFVLDEPGELKEVVTQSQDLHKLGQNYFFSKKVVHSIGQSLPLLFKQPVYQSHSMLNLSNNYAFCSCKTDQNYRLEATHTDYQLKQHHLEFESRFQSGNLALATCSKNDPRQYFLALQRDTNAQSITTQWFYFRVKNNNNTGQFTFHIVNYVKPFSMFRAGMKPCGYSVKNGKGWERAGNNIQYRKNSIHFDEEKPYYTLSFSYEFTNPDDQVFFAYCYPYTYTRLQRFLDGVQVKHSDKMRRKTITKTIGDNIVQMISITNPQYFNKKILFITARVHPGQTIGSFSCQAMINFLVSTHPDAEKLRNQFIIKIIPMLNPDGVINGNYRTSIAGDDLNRQWKQPSQIKHPEIYNAKKSIIQSQYKKLLYIDFHGHSKKKSSFMYGCTTVKSPYRGKQLPYILSKKMQNFSYYSCNFTTPKSKEGTSRISLWKAGIDYSYTYELSFCGPQRERRHFNIKDYETIGYELCLTLSHYFYSRILALQTDEQINHHCQQFYDDDELMRMGCDETNGSSSQLQDEVMKDLPVSVPISMAKTNPRRINTTQKHPSKDITHILQNYISKYQNKDVHSKVDCQNRDYFHEKKKVEIDKDVYMKQRQSFMATKVNLQQIAMQDHLFTSMSSFYGLASDKKEPIEHANSSILKNHSGSLTERKQKDSYGLLLPNVQKGQYKRYERYKKGSKSMNDDRSISVHIQNVIQKNAFNQLFSHRSSESQPVRFKKQLSLVERIRSRTNDRKVSKF